MYKIEFFKNNEKIEIEENSVKYLEKDNIIIRDTSEYLIYLDFNKKNCSLKLKEQELTVYIDVLNMSEKRTNNSIHLSYILESEPEAINEIIIKMYENKDSIDNII